MTPTAQHLYSAHPPPDMSRAGFSKTTSSPEYTGTSNKNSPEPSPPVDFHKSMVM